MSPLVDRLRERALAARAEITATGLADALHFEEAANEIERLQRAERNRDLWEAQSEAQAKELHSLRVRRGASNSRSEGAADD